MYLNPTDNTQDNSTIGTKKNLKDDPEHTAIKLHPVIQTCPQKPARLGSCAAKTSPPRELKSKDLRAFSPRNHGKAGRTRSLNQECAANSERAFSEKEY